MTLSFVIHVLILLYTYTTLLNSTPQLSKDVSDPAALQLLLAADLLSSHTESCLRLAGILAEKIKVLNAALP